MLEASLDAAKLAAEAKHVQFVIVLGDFLGHEFRQHYEEYTRDHSRDHYQLFVKKTLAFLNNEIASTFSGINVFAVVGNNDTYYRDYYSASNSPFYQQTGMLWASLIKNNKARTEMQAAFPTDGYYAIDLPIDSSSLRLIVLNTVLFSYKAKGKEVDAAAIHELNWLHDQLATAEKRHQKILIAMHIPPGIDIYASRRIRLFRLI